MKAKIRVTDLLYGKSMEIECSIHKDKSAATELLNVVRKRDVRTRIIRELKLSFGEAKLELISYDRVIAKGTMTNNVFAGGGNLRATECIPYPADKAA